MTRLPEFPEPALQVFRSVTLVGYQKMNWGMYSGANGLMSAIPAGKIFLPRSVPGYAFYLWKPFRKSCQKRNIWYDANPAYLELRVAWEWMTKKNHLFHFLSGDNEYLFSGGLKRFRKGHRIVCTFHSPSAEYSRVVSDTRALKQIDAAVVVASNQLSFFESLVGPGKVRCIPHGVHTEYWRPPDRLKPDDGITRILFLGTYLRDLVTLRSVIENVSSRSSIQFHAVPSGNDAEMLQGLSNVQIHTRVSDARLLELYQSTNILLCPLNQCTASNSLLEAMSCGVPIISTEVGGVRDYVTPGCAILTSPGNADEMTEALLALADDPGKQKQMGQAGRQRALELDWRVVALEMAGLYRDLLEQS